MNISFVHLLSSISLLLVSLSFLFPLPACLLPQGDEVLNTPPERLDLLADIVLNGPVTVVGGFFSSPTERSYIVHTVGSRLFVHVRKEDRCERLSFPCL